MKEQNIKHSGVVKSIDNGLVCVEIVSHGACSSCRSRLACGMSESAVKIVDVYTPRYSDFVVGESVVVAVTKKIGIISVVLAYIVPLIFMMLFIIIGVTLFKDSEGLVALISLFSVILYYIALYIFRDKIDNKIQFSLTKE